MCRLWQWLCLCVRYADALSCQADTRKIVIGSLGINPLLSHNHYAAILVVIPERTCALPGNGLGQGAEQWNCLQDYGIPRPSNVGALLVGIRSAFCAAWPFVPLLWCPYNHHHFSTLILFVAYPSAKKGFCGKSNKSWKIGKIGSCTRAREHNAGAAATGNTLILNSSGESDTGTASWFYNRIAGHEGGVQVVEPKSQAAANTRWASNRLGDTRATEHTRS